jgi:hypothetical protein
MFVTKRWRAAVAAVGALLIIVAVLAVLERADEAPWRVTTWVEEPTSVECQGSVVSLDFDPDGRIEARVRGETIAAADAERRGLNDDVCARAATPRGFSQRGVRYVPVHEPTEVRCRFPGRFSVYVTTVSPSWAGDRPAGSAVSLVLGRRLQGGTGPRRTIVASAVVLERADESELVFVSKYCTPS